MGGEMPGSGPEKQVSWLRAQSKCSGDKHSYHTRTLSTPSDVSLRNSLSPIAYSDLTHVNINTKTYIFSGCVLLDSHWPGQSSSSSGISCKKNGKEGDFKSINCFI